MPKFVAAVDLSKIPAVGLVPESSGTAPSSPVAGQLWVDTSSSNALKRWSGSAWVTCNLPDTGTIVDSMVSSSAAIALSKLATDPLARANHTGTQLAATISNLAATVQAYRLDQFAAPTSAVAMGSQRITGGADGTAATDFVTKQQLDNSRAGIASILNPMRVATASNINLSSLPSAVDGVTLSSTGGPDGTGDRFLVTAQTTGTQNGPYRYTGSGNAAVRVSDADATGEVLDGTITAVAEGTDAGKQYIQTATPSGGPGAWTQVWTVYSTGGTTYTADGQGIELSGSQFALELADGSLTKSASGVTVGTVTVAKGGTNASTAAGARTNLAASGVYTVLLGAVTAGTPVTVTHNLGNAYPAAVGVWEVSGGARVEATITSSSSNALTVTTAVAYSASAVQVTVAG